MATVSAYDYALSAGADLSAFACVGSLGKASVTVQATGLDGAEFSAVAPGTAAICTRTGAEGVVFECTGLPAGPTEVVVTVVETGGRAAGPCAPACPGPARPLARCTQGSASARVLRLLHLPCTCLRRSKQKATR